jgi:pimeloyl-ACP methyl ester carboxylesterase
LLLGYARVSKGDDQTNIMQARALRATGCRRIFEEAASGGRWDRPELHRLLDHLREGDTLVVWKLDRLSRSLKDVLHIMERIAAADRGGRVAHRLALDHPEALSKLVILDIVPTHLLYYRQITQEFATIFYHWFLLVQPFPFPETMVQSVSRNDGPKQRRIFSEMHLALAWREQTYRPVARLD